MRVLAFSDVHGSRRGESTIARLVAERAPDVIAVAGDFTNFGPAEPVRRLLGSLPVPTLVVPGNMDGAGAASGFSVGKSKNIHLRKEIVGGVAFVGIGGWIVSPSLHESWGVDPELAEKELSRIMPEKAVLLTHVPPYGHLDSVPVPRA